MSRTADTLFASHNAALRDPAQVVGHGAPAIDPRSLRYRTTGAWWDTLAQTGATLLVSREYEHFALALRADGTGADSAGHSVTYMALPHPSGIAVDPATCAVTIACTRNPNMIIRLAPLADPDSTDTPLMPVSARYYPGHFYMHDLAFIGGALYANSVGQNAVIRFGADGQAERVWWPRCIEVNGEPGFAQNTIQLNSIAAGSSLDTSYFSASAETVSQRRPGHKNFPVDRRGVIFSGATREPIARGLTRPHSARIHDGRLWVDNSGYGELTVAENGGIIPVAKLPGWTRGLCFQQRVAFVGSSRVLPRFRQYAPGLDVDKSRCGIHAVDLDSGKILGSIIFPYGNQIFALALAPFTSGFAFSGRSTPAAKKKRFYAFNTTKQG